MSGMTETSKVLIADASKLARTMTGKVVKSINPDTEIISVGSVDEALKHLKDNPVDLIFTALVLPDDDGTKICKYVRENQHYMPILAISGDVDKRLSDRDISTDFTDYIDKAAGQKGLELFIQGLLKPDESINGKILYVEDSKVVAHATKKLLGNHNLDCVHVLNVTEAKEHVTSREQALEEFDVVLTDFYLSNNETAQGILDYFRKDLNLNKVEMPFVVMTGDENEKNQKQILSTGANDLVSKPVNQESLIKKLKFQIRFTQFHRQKFKQAVNA